MKNKIVFVLIAILVWMLLIYNLFFNTKEIEKDLVLFNSVNIDNVNMDVCEKIKDNKIKSMCIDNYYSLYANSLMDESVCEKIENTELLYLCKKDIIIFKARNNKDRQRCSMLDSKDRGVCLEFVELEWLTENWYLSDDCKIFTERIVYNNCLKYKSFYEKK